jgi:nitrate/nitrite transport system substrate-binding protein
VPLVFAIHAGAKPFSNSTPMVITQIAGTNGAALMVKKNANISSPADFKGKTMANHSKLSVHYLINMMFLETNGLNYKEDVNFQVIDTEHILDAMKDGKVDTFVMPEPKNAVAEAKSIGDPYLLSKYIWPNHPCCSLAARRDFYDANQSLVRDVTRTITKSGLLVNQPETREETINLLQTIPDYQYDKVPKPALLKAFTPGRSDFYPFPFQSSALLIIEIMKKYNLLAATIDDRSMAREVFQSSLSRSIMAELGANPPESDFRTEKILGKLKNYAS